MGRQRRSLAVLITGAPGAGKSEAARRVAQYLAPQTALIDLDALMAIIPWRPDELHFAVLVRNFGSVLDNYLDFDVEDFVVAGVMLPGVLFERVTEALAERGLAWRVYGLRARPDTLAERIKGEQRFRDVAVRLSGSELDAFVADVPDVTEIHTDDLSPAEVASRILTSEHGWRNHLDAAVAGG
jgi:hypothetical protein